MNDLDGWLRSRLSALSGDEATSVLQVASLALAGLIFVLVATVIVAFDSFMPGRNAIAQLQVGDIAPQDIRAPFDWQYESQVLTERRRQAAMDSVAPVFDPPDPDVGRQQVQYARQILDFIDNIRRDPFGSLAQKRNDIDQITALTLDSTVVEYMLGMNDDNWRAVADEIVNVLERMMRNTIREDNLSVVRAQLPTQASVRFNDDDVALIVALVEDLVRPNTLPNLDATESARQAAAANTLPESRSFERGQIVVREGARIEPVDYEALAQLGLLQSTDRRVQQAARALLSSIVVLVVTGLYIVRFKSGLLDDVRVLALLIGLFLVVLLGARFFSSGDSQIYIYPAAALALLIVALFGAEIAVISVLGMALLVGVMMNSSLEIAAVVGVGGMIGALTLRRSERLNNYFLAGVLVALANTLVVTIFNLEGWRPDLSTLVVYSFINGIFAAAVALAGMYVVTQLFNLPTSLKLVELSQPNQPLLQRLLREAPGTYQHALQVANLGEQAANAIGAHAELVRVAALYHDIGKMMNPAFFVENQADGVNPHDVLNDPYRSAAIIISHVSDGERLARQYRLPGRVRDFILEHHGTTLVSYFYQQAVAQSGDEEAVDVDQFTYAGPKPRSRETAVMMLADSCESIVRARKPTNKQEISDIVQSIFDMRMRDGQLDDSGLTLSDIKHVRSIFVEMLQAVFHPRINYPTAPSGQADSVPDTLEKATTPEPVFQRANNVAAEPMPRPEAPAPTPSADAVQESNELAKVTLDGDDDSPLPEVPPLRRSGIMPRPPLVGDEPANSGDRPPDDRVNPE